MFKRFLSRSILTAASCALLIAPLHAQAAEQLTTNEADSKEALHVELLGRYSSGAEIGEGGTEIVVYDSDTHHAFSVNGAAKALDIIDLSGLESGEQKIPLLKQITLSDLGVSASDVTSVAIHPEGKFIAVAAPAENKVEPGHVVFMTTDGEYLTHVQVGSLPDMLTFTSNGEKVLVANEGEPNDDYSVNPEGSVSIIDVSSGARSINSESVKNVQFSNEVIGDGVRKVHPDSTFQEDLEPEYIVIDDDNQFAYVALQENNSIAKLDIANEKFVTVKSLGYKDFSNENNRFDASNKDGGIAIKNWPVLSMYMPDGMASYTVNGQSYILSANEGDAQDYDGFSEEERVASLADADLYDLNADLYAGYSQAELDQLIEDGLFNEEQLGRLNTTTQAPVNQEGKYEAVYSYGARSFSIWNANTLELTYDSGADFEEITKKVYQEAYFNSNNDENSFDSRSDDKGPEPESVTIGQIQDSNYAFIGLERVGGIMIYNIDNPATPSYNKYFSSRVFNETEDVTAASGDVAPEGLTFIPAENSPNGQNILLAAHEISGTIAAYQIGIEVEEVPDKEEEPSNEEKTPLPEGQNEDDDVPPTPKPEGNNIEREPKVEPEGGDVEAGLPVKQVKDDGENKGQDIAPKKLSSDQMENKELVAGNRLPDTATMNPFFLLLGTIISAIGFILLKRRKGAVHSS